MVHLASFNNRCYYNNSSLCLPAPVSRADGETQESAAVTLPAEPGCCSAVWSPHLSPWDLQCCPPLASASSFCWEPQVLERHWLKRSERAHRKASSCCQQEEEEVEEEAVSMASDSSALPRVTFQTPEKPGEESSHRKLGKLTIKYNRKDLQRWLDLEEWINAQLQELYQCRVSSWGKSAPCLSGGWDQRPCVLEQKLACSALLERASRCQSS